MEDDRIEYERLQRMYFQLLKALGADLEVATHADALEVATTLNRIKTSLIHSKPDETGAMFICGAAGGNGKDGLPERIMICPTMGLAGFAVYKKEHDWSEPGY